MREEQNKEIPGFLLKHVSSFRQERCSVSLILSSFATNLNVYEVIHLIHIFSSNFIKSNVKMAVGNLTDSNEIWQGPYPKGKMGENLPWFSYVESPKHPNLLPEIFNFICLSS